MLLGCFKMVHREESELRELRVIPKYDFLFRYTYTDPEFTKVLKKFDELFRTNFATIHPVNSFPWLRHLGFLFSAVSS